jgi:hypothetical protein
MNQVSSSGIRINTEVLDPCIIVMLSDDKMSWLAMILVVLLWNPCQKQR